MSTQNPSPIRVAALPESIYESRNSAQETTRPHVAGSKPRLATILEEPESQYAWNKHPRNEDNRAASVDTSGETRAPRSAHANAPIVPPTERFEKKNASPHQTHPAAERYAERYSGAESEVATNERSELADIRAQFAFESEQNVSVRPPVTIDELPSQNRVDSCAVDSLDEAFSGRAKIESPKTTHVWGIDYHVVDMEQTLDFLEQVIYTRKPSYAVTANLNYAMLCASNHRLLEFTLDSVLTLCDGMPVLWRSKLNSTPLPERVAGADLIFRLTERCAERKLRVYFYGAAEGIAEKAASALKKMYPKLIVAGVQCPPFRDCSSEEIQSQIARIKQSKPDLLFVALGQPKGEFWIEDHLEELGVPLTIQLGASFDFVAGNSTRAPQLMQKLGLEWFHRVLKDPFRLAPRYFSNFVFLFNAVRQELIDRLS